MLYIVFIAVNTDRNDEWFEWMRSTHVREVVATGCFTEATIVRDPDADTATQTGYRVIYRAHSDRAFQRYQREFGEALREEHVELFGDCTVARRELLPILLRTDAIAEK